MGERGERSNAGNAVERILKGGAIMAIYHLSVRNRRRTLHGGNAVSHLAYINADKYYDIENGKTRNYSKKKNVVFTETLIPDNAPSEYKNPAKLWNAVQKIEKNKNARLYREIEIALPTEFNLERNIELAREMAESLVKEGMCVSFAVHNVEGNPHAHLMCTTRSLDSEGKWLPKQQKVYLDKNGNVAKTKKDRVYNKKKRQYKCTSLATNDWNAKEALKQWRERWELMQNNALEREGYNIRVSCRSLKEQGIDRIPTVHEGVGRNLENKGIHSERVAENREIKDINKRYSEAKAQKEAIADERASIEQELAVIEKDIASIERKIRDMLIADQQQHFQQTNSGNVIFGEGFKKSDIQINARQQRVVKLLYNFLDNEARNIDNEYGNVSDSDCRRMQRQAEDMAIAEYRSAHPIDNSAIIKAYKDADQMLFNFEYTAEYKQIKAFEQSERPSMLRHPLRYNRWLDEKIKYEANLEKYDKLKENYSRAKKAYDNMPILNDSDILSFDSVKKSANQHYKDLFTRHKDSLMGKASAGKAPVTKAIDTVISLFEGINYNVGLTEKDEQLALFDVADILSGKNQGKSQDAQNLKEIFDIISKVLPTPPLFNKFKNAVGIALNQQQNRQKGAVNPTQRPQQPPPPRSR